MLGLPEDIIACLFDLDGVVTDTAAVHAAAWKEMFDGFLREHCARTGEGFVPFDIHDDYDNYVDGMSRADGVRSFLRSRNIGLPEGHPGDPPGEATIYGLGNRKNEIVLARIHRDGVRVFEGSVAYLQAVGKAGLRRAVVSSSANTLDVLTVTGLLDCFEVRIDGLVALERNLKGKPAPDTYLAAAESLRVEPSRCAVFEDAIAGVEAGRAGGFGWVVGVDRVGQAAALASHGAHRVVEDLEELLVNP